MAALVGFWQLGMSFLLGQLVDVSSKCTLNAPMIDTNFKNNNPPLLESTAMATVETWT